MRFLRNAIFAVGLMALAGACGGKAQEAEEPAAETTEPAEGEMPAEPAAEEGMGEEGMGGEEGGEMGEEGGDMGGEGGER